MNVKFEKVSDGTIMLEKNISPMLVSLHDNETSEENTQRWVHFRTLSDDVKENLSDDSSDAIIKKIYKQKRLNVNQVAFLARAVRLYYFGELKLEEFVEYFMKNIGVDMQTAQSMRDTLVRQIIKKSGDDKKNTNKRMTLRKAFDQFRDLQGQQITEKGLMVMGSKRKMSGTVERWITDYHLAIGQGKHSAIDRGHYLFHNRNTRLLSAAERQRVAIVLKSFDEDVEILIDTENGKIVFPEVQSVQRHESKKVVDKVQKRAIRQDDGIIKEQTISMNTTGNNPSGYVQFSSGHRMQTEKQ